MSDKLPDKVIDLKVLRINRNIGKRCKCLDKTFVVDPDNREVHCSKCGSKVDPFDAMYYLAANHEQLMDEVKRLLEQRREILNYKPWLLEVRELERRYRGKKMLPCCPHCGRGFYLNELTHWRSREYEEQIRRFEAKKREQGQD